MIDPVAGAFRDAPVEDEPISDDEERGVEEARQWLEENGARGVPHQEAMNRVLRMANRREAYR